jgi:Zn-dependent protease
MDSNLVQRLVIFFGPFLFALCFHEYAHGLVARWFGDRTAEQAGRLTMNPLAHADPIGTFAFPIISIVMGLPFSFGWAKPVPVDPRNLKNVRTDMFWIALAGPASNILLAVAATFIFAACVRLNILPSYSDGIRTLLQTFIVLNLYLAVFNIIPIHPLDGGKVLARFLPASINYKLEQNQQLLSLVLMVLLFSGFVRFLSIPVYYMADFLFRFV